MNALNCRAGEPPPTRLRPWLLPIVYQRVPLGHMGFLAELRPAAVMFLQFRGLDFDGDRQSGARLDAFVRWVQSAVTQAEESCRRQTVDDAACCCIAFRRPVAHDDDVQRARWKQHYDWARLQPSSTSSPISKSASVTDACGPAHTAADPQRPMV